MILINFDSQEYFKLKHNGRLGQTAQLPVVKVQCQDHVVASVQSVEQVKEKHVTNPLADLLTKHVAHGVTLMS